MLGILHSIKDQHDKYSFICICIVEQNSFKYGHQWLSCYLYISKDGLQGGDPNTILDDGAVPFGRQLQPT